MKNISLHLFTSLALFALSLLIPIEAQANGCDWNGTWQASTGVTLQLTQNGSSITGTYSPNNGQIQGTLSGSDFIGTWSEAPTYNAPEDAGSFEISLAGSCNSYTGRFRQGYSHHDYPWQPWSGTRQGGSGGGGGGSTPPNDPPPGDDPPPGEEPPTQLEDDEWGAEVRISQGTASINGQNRSSGSTVKLDCNESNGACTAQVESSNRSQIELYAICVENAKAILAIQLLLFIDEEEPSYSAIAKFSIAFTAARKFCEQQHLSASSVSTQQSGPDLELILSEGAIETQGGESGLSVRIETPSSVITTTSTSRISVAHDPTSGETYVATTSGSATVDPKGPGSTETVRSGEQVVVSNNGVEPAPPSSTPPPSNPPPSDDPPPSDQPPSRSLPPGTGNSLASFDTNDNNRLDDAEFFSMLDAWIAQDIGDALFFEGVDAWISDAPIAAAAISHQPLELQRIEISSAGPAYLLDIRGLAISHVDLEVYDLHGSLITLHSTTGNRLVWNPAINGNQRVANGVYLYRVIATNTRGEVLDSGVRKLAVLR